MLILVGSGVIVYTAVSPLINGAEIESLGVGIVVVGFATAVNLVVSTYLYRRARETDSAGAGGRRRAPAHRRLHLDRRARRPRAVADHGRDVARPGRRARHRCRDRLHRPRWWRAPGACSSTRHCPTTRWPRSATRSRAFADRGVVGYHQLRTRRAGARRYVDVHVQFRPGTRSRTRTPPPTNSRTRSAPVAGRRRPHPPRARGPRAPGRGGRGADAQRENAKPPSSSPTRTSAERTFCPVVKPETVRENRRLIKANWAGIRSASS